MPVIYYFLLDLITKFENIITVPTLICTEYSASSQYPRVANNLVKIHEVSQLFKVPT